MNRSEPLWHLVDSSAIGGIESHIALLADCQRRAGFEVEVLLYQEHGENPWLQQLADRGVHARILGGSFSSLRKTVAAARPALVHTHGYKAGLLGRAAAWLAGAPVVSTFHAGELGRFPVNLYQAADAYLSFGAGRIAVSDAIGQALPYSSHVIANFIQVPCAPVADPSSAIIAFVGRLSSEKGPDLFCEIAEQCAGSADFRIYGDGPMRPDLEERFDSHVTFCGLQSRMEQVWPQIGLLVMPSRAEGLPMAALEAMAAGVPLLAAEVGGLPSTVISGETGWLAPPGRPDAFAARIAEWLSLGTARRRQMAERSQELARRSFGSEQGLARVLSVYREAGWRRQDEEVFA